MSTVAAKRGWDVTEALAVDPDLFQRLVERSIVARAFFDAATIETEHPAPYFAGEEDINLVSSSLHQSLFNIYLEHQESRWPRLELTAKEITTMADGSELGDKRAANALSALGKSSLVRLCSALLRAHRAKSQAAS